MHPLLINTYDTGGAANACIRLHKGLLHENIDSKLLVRQKARNDIPEEYQIELNTIELSFGTKINNRLKNILKELKLYSPKPDKFISRRPNGLEMFSYPNSIYDITKSKLFKQADFINLHWVADFLDYPSFFRNCDKPVAWTLHDQNPFLGIEHYAEDYIGIDNNGFPIKRELTIAEKEKINEGLKIKAEAFSDFNDLHIITLCNWMKQEVENSELLKKYSVCIIPNGIDSNVFKPRNKNYSRELLNIPQNKKVLLFVSDSVNNHRKGFAYLIKAFEQINNNNIVLLSVGAKNSSLIQSNNIKELGRINDELLMSIIYSAADVFIIPSLMDNLPNTVLESIMCGTPVIGFPVGGIPDMIQDGENGYLTDEISVPALKRTIEKFIETSDTFNTEQIRHNAVKKYDLSIQA
jgi:glycosyltransferase involved in cell wall biosynthesis